MLDTTWIHLYLLQKQLRTNKDQLRDTFEKRVVITRGSLAEHRFEGWFEGMYVKVKEYNIWIKGSLCVWYKGENISMLTASEVRTAIKLLSKRTGLPLAYGILRRIDIAENFSVNMPPYQYIANMLFIERAGIYIPEPGSKYFYRDRQTVYFYDKKLEVESKHPDWHHLIEGCGNILRYELRLEKDLKDLPGLVNLKVARLFSESFLAKIGQFWLDHYDMVVKDNLMSYTAYRGKNRRYDHADQVRPTALLQKDLATGTTVTIP